MSALEDAGRLAFPPKQKDIIHRSLEDDEDRDEAVDEISELRAMIELCKNNNWACIVYINGLSVGLCNNECIIPALNEEIAEREKFLKGEQNLWE